MQLVKTEEGMGEGNILYHAVSKYTCQLPVDLAVYGMDMMKRPL